MNAGAFNIAIGGEAGQGIVTVGELLSKLLVRNGYNIVVTQSYQSRIRGGHNTFYIRTSADLIEAPQESIDLLIALDGETISIHSGKLGAGGLILADKAFASEDERCLKIPYEELSVEKFNSTAVLGVVCSILALDKEKAAALVGERFGKKHPEDVKENLAALARAFDWTDGNKDRAVQFPKAAGSGVGRMMMNGNQAIALGAVSAGARFCAFYPMTPATSVPLTLISIAERAGLVVEQVEDEIAAVNMAVGASYAGAPSMVAASGGGFALMVEGVSLAGMTETPIVFVVAQRPGPATGLPTRTEQADLGFVLHAGHGEFPRAILAPGTVEECFDLTRRAFFLAEEFQTPVFVLTDQYLADSFRAVEPFDVGNLDFVRPGSGYSHKDAGADGQAPRGGEPAPGAAAGPSRPESGAYLRHALAENGISPRLIPGMSANLVVTDSDEHTEDGHLTEDLDVRILMVGKRLKKGEGLINKSIPPEYAGDDSPQILFVSWGSSRGPVMEAARALRERGESVAVLHFSQVWPIAPGAFIEYLGKAGRVVSVEGNATGQFAGLIAGTTGFMIGERISRYDGRPLTPEYILRKFDSPAGKASDPGQKGEPA